MVDKLLPVDISSGGFTCFVIARINSWLVDCYYGILLRWGNVIARASTFPHPLTGPLQPLLLIRVELPAPRNDLPFPLREKGDVAGLVVSNWSNIFRVEKGWNHQLWIKTSSQRRKSFPHFSEIVPACLIAGNLYIALGRPAGVMKWIGLL